MVDKYEPKTWQLVMIFDCSTEEQTKIQSYGDFEFILRKIGVQELGFSPFCSVMQSISQKRKKYDPDFDFDIDYKQYPEYQNAKDAFHEINVEINYTKEEFRERYGFWQLSEFTVYERDGNQSTCTFKAGDYNHYGKYYTS